MIEMQNQLTRSPCSISFSLLRIERFDSDGIKNFFEFPIAQPTLIAVICGNMDVETDNMVLQLRSGEICYLESTTIKQIKGSTDKSFSCYMISLHVQGIGFSHESVDGLSNLTSDSEFPNLFTDQDVWKVPRLRLSRGLEQVYKNRWSADPFQRMANHIHFQEWMMFILLERQLQPGFKPDSEKAVEHAIEYMHGAYHEDITVDKLALEAKISRRHFTKLFRKLTNRTVNDYLTDLRMQEAKKLLLAGGQLSYIARAVGYRDEYYFNRRFKQVVGQSPRQYAQIKQRSLKSFMLASIPQRIVADQYMGQLLKLGALPVGVRTGMLQEEFMLPHQKKQCSLQGVADLGSEFSFCFSRVSELKPNLIVTQNEQQYETYERIAPTLVIPYQSAGPVEKLRLIANALNKCTLAEQWIETYETELEETRVQIASKLGRRSTVTNLLFLNGKLYVLGRYAGYGSFSLYQALQLQETSRQRNELNEVSLSVEIPISALPEYAGDHIFVSSYDKPSSIINSEVWKSLPAVREGRYYFSDPYRFAFEDPYSLDDQLRLIKSSLLHD